MRGSIAVICPLKYGFAIIARWTENSTALSPSACSSMSGAKITIIISR